MKELGLSCGTFNPIHLWHLLAAQCAAHQYGLFKVLLIPNGQPPHKKDDILDKELRWQMVVAAAATQPDLFEACRIELDRTGPSYTLDTLKALKAQYGDDVRLNLIIGVDNIEPIPRWYKADEIFSLCRLLIAPRILIDPARIMEMTKNLPKHCQFALIDAPTSTISSTLIRKWIREGRSVQYLLPPAVHRIILEKGLYMQVPAAAVAEPAVTTYGDEKPKADAAAGSGSPAASAPARDSATTVAAPPPPAEMK